MPAVGLPSINFAPQVSDLLPAVSTPVPGIADVTGPMLLGHVFNWALLGALTVQVYNYHVAFAKDDRLFLKLIVYGIYILDLFQTACATHYAWWVLGSGWGNPWTLRFTPWTLGLVPVLTGLIAMIVQFFFGWRINALGGAKWVLYPGIAFIALTAVGQCAAAMYSGIISNINTDVATRPNLEPPVTVWLAMSTACDIAITAMLVTQLRKRIGLGFGTYNPRLQRAIRLLIETNLITTIIVIAELITFLQRAVASWYFFFGMLIGKLYSNTLVATLNSRGQFTSGTTEIHNSTTGGQSTGVHVWKAVSRPEARVPGRGADADADDLDMDGDEELGLGRNVEVESDAGRRDPSMERDLRGSSEDETVKDDPAVKDGSMKDEKGEGSSSGKEGSLMDFKEKVA